MTGPANGTSRYRAELESRHGVTETEILEVEVTQAGPAVQVGPGRHRFVAQLGNAAGTSRSATKTVVINDFD